MRIDFKLEALNSDEEELIDGFLEQTIRNIRSDILAEVIPAKINLLEKDLLEAEWVIWDFEPSHIDMMSLLKIIVSHIGILKRVNDTYSICINHGALLPGSRTRLDTVARFIDKGTETVPCSCFISKIFNRYRDNLEDMWDEYVRYKLNHKRVSRLVFI